MCTTCGSISVTDLPGSDFLDDYYKKFNVDYHGGGRARGAKVRQARYAQVYLKLLPKLKSGKKLLDIGSSTNPFPKIAVEHGYDVTILDYTKPEDIDARIGFVKGNIDDQKVLEKLGENNFDLVTAFQVIEHCRDPMLMVQHITRLCVHKGYVIIATPLVGSFSERNALGRTPWFYPPEHIHLLSIEGMTKIFASFGHTRIKARRYELNLARWFLRYCLAYFEGIRGFVVKKLLPKYWARARNCRTSKVKELIYYVFEINKHGFVPKGQG